MLNIGDQEKTAKFVSLLPMKNLASKFKHVLTQEGPYCYPYFYPDNSSSSLNINLRVIFLKKVFILLSRLSWTALPCENGTLFFGSIWSSQMICLIAVFSTRPGISEQLMDQTQPCCLFFK